jgi:hypothetical protein
MRHWEWGRYHGAPTLPSSARLLSGRPKGVPPQSSHRRNRPARRFAVSTTITRSPISTTAIRSRPTAIRFALVVTAIWLIATGVYFAFSDGVLPRLIDGQIKVQNHYKDHIAELSAQVDRMSVQFLHNQQVEQQLAAQLNERVDRIEQLGQNMSALADLLRTGTIKQDRIESPITLDVTAPSSREAPSKSRELLAAATTKQHKIPRAAHQRASSRHRIAVAEHISRQASPVGTWPQSSQVPSMTMKPHAGIIDQ